MTNKTTNKKIVELFPSNRRACTYIQMTKKIDRDEEDDPEIGPSQ